MSNWVTYHQESERYASLAEEASRKCELEQAFKLYQSAAEAEVHALDSLTPSKLRTLGITAVSAASLWFKSRNFQQAKTVIHKCLSNNSLPPFAVEQLESLLQVIWSEESRDRSGVEFAKGEVLVSVSGGEIVTGGAPLDLILRKVNEVGNLFYRTIEMLLDKPLRLRGAPSLEIQEQCRPWLFQAPPGSYQFAVRVEKPRQLSLFPDDIPSAEQITNKFIEIVKAASSRDLEGEEIAKVVPKEEYQDAFLKMTRNLAPTANSKSFDQIVVKSASDIEANPIVLSSESRDVINQVLKQRNLDERASVDSDLKKTRLQGILRGLQLDKDWIEISVVKEGASNLVRVDNASDVIDDVVGSMVNRKVIVDVIEQNGKYAFVDIQTEE